MRNLFLFILALICNIDSVYGQRKDYKFSFPKHVSIVYGEQNEGGYSDVYTVYSDKDTTSVRYVISVLRYASKGVTYEGLLTKEYEMGFENNCGCSTTRVTRVNYAHFKGVEFMIRMVNEGTVLVGYSISAVSKDNTYNISFFIKGGTDVTLYDSEFNKVLNSFYFE